jgi:hypothetical protein
LRRLFFFVLVGWRKMANKIFQILFILFILSSVIFSCAQPAAEPPAETATFTPGNLVITPTEIYPGDTISISVYVQNTGNKAGSYTAELRINGTAETSQTVTVDAGASKQVVFTITGKEPGEYTVDVNSLEGKFTVLAREMPTSTVVLNDEQFNKIAQKITGSVLYQYNLHFIENNKVKVTSAIVFTMDMDVCDGRMCFTNVELLAWHNIFENGKQYLNYDNPPVMTVYYLSPELANDMFGEGIDSLPKIKSISTSEGEISITYFLSQ